MLGQLICMYSDNNEGIMSVRTSLVPRLRLASKKKKESGEVHIQAMSHCNLWCHPFHQMTHALATSLYE